MESGWKPNVPEVSVSVTPACPRCGSSNTKFCYYNNYSLTQPRYFCKGCRRYWTKGGSLRNVPIGGGCRKSRRGKSAIRVSSDVGCAHSSNYNSSLSSSLPDGPDHQSSIPSSSIDLAAVYANFLSPALKPRVDQSASPMPLVEFPNFQNFNSHLINQESGFIDCGTFPGKLLLSEPSHELLGPDHHENSMYFSGFESFQKHTQNVASGSSFIGPAGMNNNINASLMLPPLPGEDDVAVTDGMLWPGSNHHDLILPNNNRVDHDEAQGGPNSELLSTTGNVSTFSDLNLEAIFRS